MTSKLNIDLITLSIPKELVLYYVLPPFILVVLGFWLKLLNSKVLHDSALSLYLGCSDVNGMIASLSLVVYLLDVKNKLEVYFDLSLNYILGHLFPSVSFSTLLFYLGLYGGLKAFSKVSNKDGLFWSPIIIKL